MVKVTPHWAIPIVNWEKEFVNLTWSATVYEVGWLKILIDLWMFQGSEGSDIFNKENTNFIKDIDVVLVTHAHIDHIWRLPLLNKMWYEWVIYMSSATKEIVAEMLLDSLKIQEKDSRLKQKVNKQLWNRLKESLKILKYFSDLRQNNLNSEDKNKIISYLYGKLWKEYNESEITNQLNEYLSYFWVKDETDIEYVLAKLRQTLFSMEDIVKTMDKIKTIDLQEEKILVSRVKKVENNNHKYSEILENLPQRVNQWYQTIIEVNSKWAKADLKASWEEKLKQEIKKVLESNIDLKAYKEDFRKEYESYLTYLKQYWFLEKDIDKNDPAYLNQSHFNNIDEYNQIRKNIRTYRKKLNELNIKDSNWIDIILWDDEKIVELLKIEIPYNSEDIKKALSLIEVKKENWPREIVWITWIEAAHVVWSMQIQIISWEVKRQIKSLTEIKWDGFCAHFSWDLWRIENNRLWRPEIPLHQVDYLQIESTYGWRNHRNRQESVKELMDSIYNSNWDVLIAAFSQQRKQEILLTIIEEFISKWSNILDYEILVDAPLAEKLTNIYFKHNWEVYDLLKDVTQIAMFGKVIFRYLEEWEFEFIHKQKVNTEDIDRLLELNLEHEKLQWLNKKAKKDISIIKEEVKQNKDKIEDFSIYYNELKQILWIELYNEFILANKKRIIIASSWMMDGWAIMNHLPHILSDMNSTLLAPWYLAEWTIWHQIIHWKWKYVTINWDKIEIKSKNKFIDWFSSHIGHNEILQYITESIKAWKFKKNAIISLTHWSLRWQKLLKDDLNEILKWFNRTDIKIIIPEFWDNIYIGEKKVEKAKKVVLPEVKKELKTPKFLMTQTKKTNQVEEIEEDEKEEENEIKIKNFESINLLKSKISDRISSLESEISTVLYRHLKAQYISKLKRLTNKLSKLSYEQRSLFFRDIDSKLLKSRVINNDISTLKTHINWLFDIEREISHFINIWAKEIKNEILELTKEVDLLNEEKIIAEQEISEIVHLNNKLKISTLRRNLASINKKIKTKVDKISALNKKKSSFEINIKRNLKTYLPIAISQKVLDTLDVIWKKPEELEIFRSQIKEAISIKKSQIILSRWEADSHIKINFSKKELNFEWRDLYSQLVKNNEDLNIEELKKSINLFNLEDREFVENQLEIITWKNSSIQKNKAAKLIKKLIKDRCNENKNLWIDLELDFYEIEQMHLSVLKDLFQEDYYNDYILPNFNIYLYFKSGKSFIDFVSNRYDYKKLNRYNELSKEKLEKISDLEYYSTLLQRLENSNVVLTSNNDLNDINFWIETTKEEVMRIINSK